MAHGGHQKHRVAGKPMRNGDSNRKGLGAKRSLDKTKEKKKTKAASIKNQIRSVERLLKKNLPAEAQDVQRKRLEDLKKQAEEHQHSELERKMSLRYRGVKFFERRKIERRIKRLEKLLEGTDAAEAVSMKDDPDLNKQLLQLKEDLEYVRFFPKTKKYVSLFVGNEDEEVIAKRSTLREQIKVNLTAAAALGVGPDDMDDDEDPTMAVSDDDFFLAESSSDTAEAADQFTFTSSKTGSKTPASKNTATLSAKHISASKNQQSNQTTFNTGSGLKIHKQRPGPMFRNKDKQRNHSIGVDSKVKDRKLDGPRHQSTTKNNKIKERSSSQKQNLTPHSCSLQQIHSRRQQAFGSSFNTASSVTVSKIYRDSFSVPSHVRADASEDPSLPQFGISNLDAPKKRRRKHRPKKKKA